VGDDETGSTGSKSNPTDGKGGVKRAKFKSSAVWWKEKTHTAHGVGFGAWGKGPPRIGGAAGKGHVVRIGGGDKGSQNQAELSFLRKITRRHSKSAGMSVHQSSALEVSDRMGPFRSNHVPGPTEAV